MALIMEEKPPPRPRHASAEERHGAWLPAALDERLRLILAASTVTYLALVGVQTLLGGLEPRSLAGLAAFSLVGASVWGGFRRGRRPAVLDPIEAALLLGAGLLIGESHATEFVFLLALSNASLYRRTLGRCLLTGYFLVALLTLVASVDGGLAHAAVVHLPRLLLATLLPIVVGDMAKIAERAVQRERILGRVGKDLAAEAHDVEHVGRVASDAAYDLVRSAEVRGPVLTSLFVGDGMLRRVTSTGEVGRPLIDAVDFDRMAAVEATDITTKIFGDRSVMTVLFAGADLNAVMRAHDLPEVDSAHVLVVPLFARNVLRGLITVSMDEVPDTPLRGALENLGADTVLALDAIEMATTVAAREREVRRLLTHSTDAMTVLDADLRLSFEACGSRLLGWPSERLVTVDLGFLVHPDDQAHLLRTFERSAAEPGVPLTCEWRAKHADGRWVALETIITNLLDDHDVQGFLLNSRDVSERKALEEHIAHQSLHDPVTGLSNRTLFVDRVAHALERSKRRSRVPAVCFLDLDGFKQVNETYGHETGDQLLRVVADRLRGSLREGDTAARFSGDTFAVLMEECVDAQVGAVVTRLHDALCMPVVVEGRTLKVKVTVGVATPHPAWTSRELLQAVDAALFVAKREARGSWRRYDDTLPKPGEQDGLLDALEQAVEENQLRLQYQPVVSLETGAITAVEALVRWHHPDRGMIPPNSFIPLAERSGLIIPIGHWVLETATRQLKRWHAAFPEREPLSLHVNVSAVQLADAAAVARIGEVIERSGVAPEHITLEITESVLVADPLAANQQLASLKAIGVRLAIDDFGVGYAGLGYLREFSVDQLKIDKSFVDTLATSGDTELFEAMLGFSQAFKLDTVAEGVEDAEQAEILVRLGCTNAQGYHFARPLDPIDLEGLLARVAPLAPTASGPPYTN
jgi:diguanylate cyclase (GGDEF)-like protein/PAS domain S-box-containing protein